MPNELATNRKVIAAWTFTLLLCGATLGARAQQATQLPMNCDAVNAELDRLYRELSEHRDSIASIEKELRQFQNPGPDIARFELGRAVSEDQRIQTLGGTREKLRKEGTYFDTLRALDMRLSYWGYWNNRLNNHQEDEQMSRDAAEYFTNHSESLQRELSKFRRWYSNANREIDQLRTVSETLKCNTYNPSPPSQPPPATGTGGANPAPLPPASTFEILPPWEKLPPGPQGAPVPQKPANPPSPPAGQPPSGSRGPSTAIVDISGRWRASNGVVRVLTQTGNRVQWVADYLADVPTHEEATVTIIGTTFTGSVTLSNTRIGMQTLPNVGHVALDQNGRAVTIDYGGQLWTRQP